MSIELEPSAQLGFRRPLTEAIKESLIIRNPTQLPIAFKVKTTAPKQYCVRPNSGRVEPGQQLEVQVQMQAMKEDPPIDFKCKDKFLVQSVAITAEREQLAPADLWPTIERDAKDQIREKKIRCVFLAEHEITQIKEEETEQLTSSRSSSAAQSTHSTINSHPAPQTSITTTSSETPVSTATLAEIAALKRELQTAQETIQKLQGEASVLRQRKPETASSAPVMTSVHVKTQQEGYPVTYVYGAAVAAFLFAYIFF
ncbi:phosphatidylinositol-binding protein scs2 [Mortierella sp. AD011]|nr:phosphatidylinositol-binding protein scs2 [Mortierella sp. AD010]KAF9390452.1 phosphatidylinositol-binding protein scs2 [Mortierella sp. AD011]